MKPEDQPRSGELCKDCSRSRAVAHYHGTPAKYCARCQSIQERALLADRSTLSPGGTA